MTCPLCNKNFNNEVLFYKNCCVSAGKLNDKPYNGRGGDIAKISLVQCNNCGYIYNCDFNLEQINKEYSSKNYFLKRPVSSSMSEIIKILKNKITNFNKNNFLEIAPGNGDLAIALAPNSNIYYTIDPSITSLRIHGIQNIYHIQDFFNYNLVKNKIKHKIDFIIFRHLLEHLNTPYNFLENIEKLAHDDTIVYIEVPNIEEIIQHSRFYDIFNDHFGYFQKNTLMNMMNKFGFELIDEIYPFRNQHMGLFFKKNNLKSLSPLLDVKIYYKINFKENIDYINSLLKNYVNIGIYGAGHHGNSLISSLVKSNIDKIKTCFDLDPKKQNKYLQNSIAQVMKPCIENFKNIDCIIIATSLYEEEVVKSLRKLGYKKDIITTEKEIKILK